MQVLQVLCAVFAYVGVAGDAGAHQEQRALNFVTRLSPLDTPKVRFVFAAPSPQITDLKTAMLIASHACYYPRRKKLYQSPKIGWIGRVQEDVDGQIRPHVDSFDFFNTTNLSRFP